MDLEIAIRVTRDLHESYTFTHTRQTTSGEIDFDIDYCQVCIDSDGNRVFFPCPTYETLTKALADSTLRGNLEQVGEQQ